MTAEHRADHGDRATIDTRLRELFQAPPRDFSPTPLWWWSGEEVTEERMEWQLRRFAAGGIYNLVLINLAPAGPQFGAETDNPQWFSPVWWQRVERACELAEELGMRLWFYDQIGFSGANLQGRVTREHPWAAGSTLRSRAGELAGGRPVLFGEESLVGIYTEAGGLLPTAPDGAVPGAEHGPVQLVTAVPTAFDYLNPAAVRLLLDRVHGEFDRRLPQYLGTVIAGSFQDELPSTNPWTDSFLEEFRTRQGYDLHPHLPALFGSADAHAGKIRSDYYAVRAALTEEALFLPLGRWHEERGMLIGADQSNPARAGLPVQSTQIYTDYPRTHRHLSAVGSDHEGDAKFHASLAKLYDHDRVWLEAFHSSGWGGTLEDTWDWLLPFFRRGATLYNPHASYFSTVGGWFEWAPPSTDWRQPYWRHYRQFAAAVSRVAATMTWGRAVADVAVLHPTATMQASLPLDMPITHFGASSFEQAGTDVARTQQVYLDLVGKDDWFHFQPSALDRAGLCFDIIDDASLDRSEHEPGAIRVGEDSWSTVLVPSAQFLEQGTAQALIELLDRGGRVLVVGELPVYATGRFGGDDVVRVLAEHERLEHVADADAAVAVLADLGQAQYAGTDAPLLVRRSGRSAVALVGGAYPNATGYPLRSEAGLGRVPDYDFDRARYVTERVLHVAAPVAAAEVWDPATGAQRAVRIESRGERSVLHVDTGGAPLVLVAWEEGPGAEVTPPSPALPAEQTTDLSTGWTGSLVPTLDNTWGDLARPTGRRLHTLQIWTLDAREDDGDWQPTWATAGERARVLSTSAEQAPAPLGPGECDRVGRGESSLADPSWEVLEWSRSRGARRDSSGELGTKGRITSEFLTTGALAEGEVVTVRTLLQTDHRGPADLVLVAPAQLEVWWNGRVMPTDSRYTRQLPVHLDRAVNVLEFRLRRDPEQASLWYDDDLRFAFSLYPPEGFDRRPEFIAAAPSGPEEQPGRLTFTCPLPRLAGLESAQLVLGAARPVTLRLDDEVIARQEKVEYYESERGATPAFFSHDVTEALRRGAAAIVVELDGATAQDVIWLDLGVQLEDGTTWTCVSDESWSVADARGSGGARVVNRYYGQPEARYAVSRPHLLPEAHWLRGRPERGSPALDFHAGDSAAPAVQHYRALLPAGTASVELDLMTAVRVRLDGHDMTPEGDRLHLDHPLPRPALLELETPPTSTHRRGSAFAGPLEVHHTAAAISLGDWRALGLSAWSGGVRYVRTVDLPTTRDWVLDLGDLRGSVEVQVDGEPIGSAFCAPFRFTVPGRAGPREVAVSVFNTLGPFLHESTATTWVLESQLASGLYGPVLAHVHEREDQ